MESNKFKIVTNEVILLMVTFKNKREEKNLSLEKCLKYLETRIDLASIVIQTAAQESNSNTGFEVVFQCVPASTKIPESAAPIDFYNLIQPLKPTIWLGYGMHNPDKANFIAYGKTLNEAIENFENAINSENGGIAFIRKSN